MSSERSRLVRRITYIEAEAGRSRIRRHNSGPSAPGIIQSMMASFGVSVDVMISHAASPSRAIVGSMCQPARARVRMAIASGSSSAMRARVDMTEPIIDRAVLNELRYIGSDLLRQAIDIF